MTNHPNRSKMPAMMREYQSTEYSPVGHAREPWLAFDGGQYLRHRTEAEAEQWLDERRHYAYVTRKKHKIEPVPGRKQLSGFRSDRQDPGQE